MSMYEYKENHRKHLNTVHGQDDNDCTLQYLLYIVKFRLYVVDVSQQCLPLLQSNYWPGQPLYVPGD